MSDPITRLNVALEGRYNIERELGEGGMATVYLADDLKHERKVALKVLKPELAAVVGAERFLCRNQDDGQPDPPTSPSSRSSGPSRVGCGAYSESLGVARIRRKADGVQGA